MKIGITYNLKDEVSPQSILNDELCEEFDTRETIEAISRVFAHNGHTAVKLGGDINILERLKEEKVGFVFNIAEGYRGRNRESHIPSLLEMLNIPYSGSDPLTLGMTLDKTVAKRIALHAGIPSPRYRSARSLDELKDITSELKYPLITKPAHEGSSKGIYNSSKVHDRWELQKSAKYLFKKYPDQPVLIEEYIEGREITAGIVGNDPPSVIGLMEIVNKKSPGKDIFYSLETKRDWEKLVSYVSPPKIDRMTDQTIRRYALSVFEAFGCRDVARIDFKLSREDMVYMIEINPLPGLSPQYADLVIMSKRQRVSYNDLVMSILNSAISRYSHFKRTKAHEKI